MSDASPDKAPDSPCIRNCCLDEHDVCLGCKRTLQEILDWHRMTPEQKRQLLSELAQRRLQAGSEQPRASKTKRCFLGLAVPHPIREQLSRAAATLQTQPATRAFRWTPPENYHLTLAFLDSQSDERIQHLTERLGRERWLPDDFRIDADWVGGFPNTSHSRYLVAQVEVSSELLTLHQRLQALLAQEGFPTEARALRPHITLARLRRGQHPPFIEPQPLSLSFPADALTLFESRTAPEGASYQALASFR